MSLPTDPQAQLARLLELNEDMAAALTAVLDLHKPDVTDVLTGDCAAEECDHDDINDCDTAEFTYCTECNQLAETINPYFPENGIGDVAWPCPTVRAITNALGESREDQ